MSTEVIYQKEYQRKNMLTEIETSLKVFSTIHKPKHSFAEFYNRLQVSQELVPIPKREGKSKEFIDLAIETSKMYELDIVITRHKSHISVDLSFDCGSRMKHLKPILAFADDYSFFTGIFGREITVCLDYYTHYILRNGKQVAP